MIINEELCRQSILAEIKELNLNTLKEYFIKEYSHSLNEMAKINTKEFYGYFPYNKFDVRIWSNDHNPPHFHVIGDGWDIVVSIDNGEIIRVKQQGKSSKFFHYVKDVVKDWLKEPCAIKHSITNQENAEMQWTQNNSYLE